LFGRKPQIISSVGKDYDTYFVWMKENNLETEGIRIVDTEMTAVAYIISDNKANRITVFVPGAMGYPSEYDISKMQADNTLGVVSPGNLEDMRNYCHDFTKYGIPYIFSPGQSLSWWDTGELILCIKGAFITVINNTELSLIYRKTGLTTNELMAKGQAFIVTLGEEGSVVYANNSETVIPFVTPDMVVDSHGAGDAFTGGLTEGVLEGKTILESVIVANVCASFSIEYYGTQGFSFSQDGFSKRLENLKGKMNWI
jgi:adenosine kinase